MTARVRETWHDAVRALDRDPGEQWSERAAHHGARAVFVLAVAAGLPFLFPRSPLPEAVSLSEGAVADVDVIAAFSFDVPKGQDQVAAERAEAQRAVPPVYVLDPAAADSSRIRAIRFLAAVDSASAGDSLGMGAVADLSERFGIRLPAVHWAQLADAERRRTLRAALTRAWEELLPRGFAPVIDVPGSTPGVVLVRGPDGDRRVSRDSVRTIGDFLEAGADFLPRDLPVEAFQLFQSLLYRFTVPSLRFDQTTSELARERARAAVDTTLGTVLEGERIITAHERVSSLDLRRLRAYNQELAERGLASVESRRRIGIGTTLHVALMLGLLAVVLALFRPAIYRDMKSFLIVTGLVAAALAGAAVVYRVEFPPELVPVVLVAVVLAALWDGLVALVAVFASVLALAGLTDAGLSYHPFVLLTAGAVAALGVRGMRRRTHGWILIAAVTGGYLLAGGAAALIQTLPVRVPAGTLAWGGMAATLYTFLALGAAIPILERLTGISTDQTLLELSDLNAPLLRELSRKAPGTYAHSINVANLSEAACLAIGANALLARAGVYYHDIGKMENPQYFVENQPKGRNPHDRLPPARSASLIRDHVRDGLRLAAEHRLPPVIHDFVREHHGTTLVSFFYGKARAERPDADLDPGDFAYPGPRPQTRETAVVMLADGIESSTRVLQDPTPERIRGAIEAIVEARIREGQLDQCPLTLRDLELVQDAFGKVLVGMYHRRIEYPSGVQARESGRHGAAERAG
ncbi:MAG: HDIG domain-containing protein [Gemmatimonadota bacterium]|nr:HDIG domain-containing protein [Gemmatimonadota bacterium]